MIQMTPDEGGVRDADGVGFDSPFDLLIESHAGGLGWCACGDIDRALDLVCGYLAALHWSSLQEGRHPREREHAGINEDAWLLLSYLCDAAGWTEHGISVRGAWLTEEGRQALWMLTERALAEGASR